MIRFFLLLLFTTSTTAHAGLFRAESVSLTTTRANDQRKLEQPIFEQMAASYMNDAGDVELNTNFSLLANPGNSAVNDAELYILDAKFPLVSDLLNMRVGRSFDTQNVIGAATIDMVSAEFLLAKKRLRIGAFAGIERKPELETLSSSADLRGAHMNYRSTSEYPLFLSTKFVNRKNNTLANPVENLLQVSGKQALPLPWSPELIVDSAGNLSKSNLDRLETGFDFYPSVNSFAKLRYLTHDVLPDTGVEQPIYSIFAQGRLYEVRAQYETKLAARWRGSMSLFHTNYVLQGTTRTKGYGSELETRYLGDGINVNDVVYYFDSFGGRVYGNRVHLEKQAFGPNEFYAGADVTYYKKITSSKRFATATEFGWARVLGDRFKLKFGGEYNSNNILKHDLRAVLRLTYVTWGEI